MQRAVDGNNVATLKQLVQSGDALASNLLFLLLTKGLVVKVQELLAIKGFETTQDALTNSTYRDGADDLVLEIVFLLGDGCDIPFATLNLFVSRNKVAYQDQDCHDDVLGNGHDIAASYFGHGDTTICLVGSVEVNVIRTDTGGDGKLEFLCLGQTLCGQITGMKS